MQRAFYRSWWVDLAVRLVYYCGLLHVVGFWRRWFGRKRLIVLLYHRLVQEGDTSAICGLELDEPVPVGRFEGHLQLLRWFGEPLRLDDAVERLHDATSVARTFISVTFDDGYRDNYTVGRPVWKRHRVPVTLYPAVAAVEHGSWLWWDELQKIVGEAELNCERVRMLAEVLHEVSGGPVWRGDTAVAGAREAFVRFLFLRLVEMPIELREAVLEELARQLGVTRPRRPASLASDASRSNDRLYVNWQELAELAEDGVQIGGHTVRHPRLPREPDTIAQSEIADCRALLQAATAQPVTSFADPGGFYERRDLELLSRAGYRTAVTVRKGVNYPETDPLELCRIPMSWDEPHHLAFKLAFADWLFPS